MTACERSSLIPFHIVEVRSLVKTKLKLNKPGRHTIKAEKEKREKEMAEQLKKEQEEFKKSDTQKMKEKDAEDFRLKNNYTDQILSAPRPSHESHRSHDSKKSGKSDKKKTDGGGVVKDLLAAASGKDALVFDAPAPKIKVDRDGDGDLDTESEDDLDDHAFDHPSTYQDQPWIWIPQWEAHPRLSKQLVDDITSLGVDASDVGAIIEDNGTITVRRSPPDEVWEGGLNL